MKLEEILFLIPKKTGRTINQSVLAEILGITRQTVSNRIKNSSQLTVSELTKIEAFFNLKIFGEAENYEELVYIDFYKDVFASCGNGNVVFSEEKVKIPMPIQLIKNFSKKKSYSLINATGNSMSPTINSGDKLIIEMLTENQIQDNKVHVFCFNDEIFVKRLCKNFDEIIIKSDNHEYRTRTISDSTMNELILLGKVVGVIKTV